ncbi:hypothetical protein RHMOL_Rhmol04G0269800 [Rhododendron molle]|uniref:Uncharacterized protein n=1 Tax=Rhododendron molle TaxID=49168 RepID=A0ACC0P506_RHOML|nr:hypothetical protein RHMOL_Rhmol04G0269800 [Rhododendron molle]
MAQISACSLISPMESANYRKGNLLSPPHHSSFALHSHSHTINHRSSTPATIISQAKRQPNFERKMLRKEKPRPGNLSLEERVPTIVKINKALTITTKKGDYSTALSRFNKLQLLGIELDLYTFSIAINCNCQVNRVGFGFSLLGSISKSGYNEVIFGTLLHGLVAQDKVAEALSFRQVAVT